jgi:hypothetical protein
MEGKAEEIDLVVFYKLYYFPFKVLYIINNC